MSVFGARREGRDLNNHTTQQLHDWVRCGDLDAVKNYCNDLRAQGAAPPLQYMLEIAVSGNSIPMLQLLFAEGARIDQNVSNYVGDRSSRPIDFFRTLADNGWPQGYRALEKNLHLGEDIVALLLERGHIIDVSCLKTAVNLELVRVLDLLMWNIDPRCKVPTTLDYLKAIDDPGYWSNWAMFSEPASLRRIIDGAGLLQAAADQKNFEMVQYLLRAGANLDLVPVEEQSPDGINGCALHKAVSVSVNGRPPRLDIVEALLDAGADPMLKDSFGRTALEINDVWGDESKEEIRQLLLAKMYPV